MATMIPRQPVEIPENSMEDIMYSALEQLPDEYYVFHSFKILAKNNGVITESETDFVVFHPQKGILCIEAKAGRVRCTDGIWYYASGKVMNHGGPFNQANMNKWKLDKLFKDRGMLEILQHCKLLHAVWFPSIDKPSLDRLDLPPDADKSIILTSESLNRPEQDIERIFALKVARDVKTNITAKELSKVIKNVICPSFDLLPSVMSSLDLHRTVFNRLLKEQSNLLNFLEEQPYAIINGIAGTGKTMIAVEKARRHGEMKEKVLFLCFNKQLCDFLKDTYPHEYVSYYTVDALACSYCNTQVADFGLLQRKLEDSYYENTFPYQHVIIDEGQDFGQDRIEESNIIDLLETLVLDNENFLGTFYLFYDKNQLIQGRAIPKYISEADCKLTLYKNCRNTENIAITSIRPLGEDIRLRMFEDCIKGDSPRIHIRQSIETQITSLEREIKHYQDKGITDIVILTCSTEEKSILNGKTVNGRYTVGDRAFKFTSCRKFKGLEADAIILFDVDKSVFVNQNNLVFYVGASRARFGLSIVCNMSEADCMEVVSIFGVTGNQRPFRMLAASLNALHID